MAKYVLFVNKYSQYGLSYAYTLKNPRIFHCNMDPEALYMCIYAYIDIYELNMSTYMANMA